MYYQDFASFEGAPDWNVLSIALAAGMPETKFPAQEERDGGKVRIFVPDVSQGDLDAAVAAYDHAQNAKDLAKKTVRQRIDELRLAITGRFTQTEQDGWINTKAEADAIVADPNADAPGLRLQAQIEGVEPIDMANAILAAAEVTALLPSIAAGMRAKANELIDATDGSEDQISAVLADLSAQAEEIVTAAASGDKDALMAAVTV